DVAAGGALAVSPGALGPAEQSVLHEVDGALHRGALVGEQHPERERQPALGELLPVAGGELQVSPADELLAEPQADGPPGPRRRRPGRAFEPAASSASGPRRAPSRGRLPPAACRRPEPAPRQPASSPRRGASTAGVARGCPTS